MYSFIKDREGDVWVVCKNLIQASEALATPRAAKKGQQNPLSGENLQQDGRVVVLGFAWWATWAATGKGFSPSTMGLVRDAVRAAADGVSAAELAGSLGISRPTAQRYLSQLAQQGTVEIVLR